MSGLVRELLCLVAAAALSWVAIFGLGTSDVGGAQAAPPVEPRTLPVAVRPELAPRMQAVEPAAAPERARPEAEEQLAQASPSPGREPEVPEPAVSEPEPAATEPEPETGAPDGADDGTRPTTARDTSGLSGRTTGELERDPELAAAARAELSGEVRRGFDTVLLASPEEQLDIARAFGEELVLVPRSALDPESAPHYYRLALEAPAAPSVERVAAQPPLELRRYRDLFDYEYARLPDALRLLRRSVLARSEVYVFAALIPLSEWAVVVGRRREALDAAGVSPDDVRRFDLRYVRMSDGRFDLRVEAIVLADGRSISPEPRLSAKELR